MKLGYRAVLKLKYIKGQMKMCFPIFLLLFHALGLLSQDKIANVELRTVNDCNVAIPLTIAKSCHYGPTIPSKSYGKFQEITTSDKNSEISFSEEHNSAWYLLNIKFDGELTFEIIPVDSNNDYDFLVYPYTDSNFCANLLGRTVNPIRSNISNETKWNNKGTTGLSVNEVQEFHKQGPGNPFSKSLPVKKGEKYMLVLDNVSPNGKGHTIYLHSLMQVEIKGSVFDSDSLPLIAEVTLSDNKGKPVAHTIADVQGKYEIKTAIEENRNYSLTFLNDSSFISTVNINTVDLKGSHSFPDIRTILPKLKKGAKYPLGNINFFPGVATLLPQSYASVDALYHLMAKNKKMIILIEGHINGYAINSKDPGEAFPGEYQDLSEDRARTVRDYLLRKGIVKERMNIIGLAATQMLFPHHKTEQEASANRRVEIKIITIHGE